jgi:hypothetical protein
VELQNKSDSQQERLHAQAQVEFLNNLRRKESHKGES